MPFSAPPPLPAFLARELPFERATFEIPTGPDAGRRIHLIDHRGEGLPPDAPTVYLQHGNPTWCYLWRKVLALLAGKARLIAPDLLGLGFSDTLKIADHTLARHAGAMTGLMEALIAERGLANGGSKLVIVGQDWGGPVAVGVGARLAETHPGLVRGVVLGNTAVLAPQNPRGAAFHRFARMPIVSDLAFRVLGFPLRSLHKVQGDPGSIRGEVARAYRYPLGGGPLRAWKRRAAPLALARMVPDSPEHPTMAQLARGEGWLREFAAENEGAVELVWGMKDPILGRALKRHEEELPGARVTRTGAGHFLQEEVPEELAGAVGRVV